MAQLDCTLFFFFIFLFFLFFFKSSTGCLPAVAGATAFNIYVFRMAFIVAVENTFLWFYGFSACISRLFSL